MTLSLPNPPEPLTFRFFADFSIQIQPIEIVGLTKKQVVLLQAIAASPPILRQIACMRLETDLAGVTGRHLSGLIDGPDTEGILDCVLPCLSDKERPYWERLRNGSGDSLHQEIMPVFLAFEVSLRVAGIEQRSAGDEDFRKTVGSILDADDQVGW